jgi:hypothetical protein
VTLLEPVEQTLALTVTGEARTAREGSLVIPLLRPSGVDRETGAVGIEVLGAGEIKEQTMRGLDPADPSELGEAILARVSPALAAFRFRPQPADAPRALQVTIARYTPQAVLLANIEEARYRALLAEDGKVLVEARYAVRNSQRSFLGVTLPDGATLWSAAIDGRPVRPGRTPEGGLLLPILKNRADTQSVSGVSLLCVYRGGRWEDIGTAGVRLPVVDLPVSRTGLVVYHSSRYKLTLEPGPLRLQAYEPPQSAALREAERGGLVPVQAIDASREKAQAPKPDQALQDLAGVYQRTIRSGAVAGLLPVDLPFPALGPSIYLAAELTAEGRATEARFSFKREVK